MGLNPMISNQIFEEPKKFALNLKTAVSIGYVAPLEILGAADEIYETSIPIRSQIIILMMLYSAPAVVANSCPDQIKNRSISDRSVAELFLR